MKRALAITAAALALGQGGCGEPAEERQHDPSTATARVSRVVDGDTIDVVAGGRGERVRYIGVDTPESAIPGEPPECFGRRAAALNRSLLSGSRVELRYGPELRDPYGRLLAYVYAHGRMVNAELVRRGAARAMEIEPNTARAELFGRLQSRAARRGRGLWRVC